MGGRRSRSSNEGERTRERKILARSFFSSRADWFRTGDEVDLRSSSLLQSVLIAIPPPDAPSPYYPIEKLLMVAATSRTRSRSRSRGKGGKSTTTAIERKSSPSTPTSSPSQPRRLWTSTNASKRWAETFFLAYSPFWMTWALCIVVPFEIYEVRRRGEGKKAQRERRIERENRERVSFLSSLSPSSLSLSLSL